MSALPRLVVILGPTASGKSALGISLAEQLGGEILVCDSTQVYRHFDIGTAKVPAAEQRGHSRITWWISCEPAEIFTAGDYRRRALEALGQICARARYCRFSPPGPGLYLARASRRPGRCAATFRRITRAIAAAAEQRGPEHLHRVLARLDPESAARIGRARHAKNNSRHRIASAHRKTDRRNPSQRPRSAARLRSNQDRPAAAARRAVRAHSRSASMPCSQPDGCEEVRAARRERRSGRRQAVSVHRLLAIARTSGRTPQRKRRRRTKSSRPRAVSQSAKSPGFAKKPASTGSQDSATPRKFSPQRSRSQNCNNPANLTRSMHSGIVSRHT